MKDKLIVKDYNGQKMEISLEFSRYNSNNSIAIIGKDGFEVYDYFTCNGRDNLSDDYVSFRSDYPEYAKALIEANYIEEEPSYIEPSGYIFLYYYKLLPEAKKFILERIE